MDGSLKMTSSTLSGPYTVLVQCAPQTDGRAQVFVKSWNFQKMLAGSDAAQERVKNIEQERRFRVFGLGSKYLNSM